MKVFAVVLQLVGLLTAAAGVGLLFGPGAYLVAVGAAVVAVGTLIERENT